MVKALSSEDIARRVARDIPNGAYVNLGIGMPMLVATASEEAIVDTAAAARVLPGLKGARHVVIDGASHEIFMETDERRAVWLKAFDELCASARV